jgi:uncharacterized protein YwgA
MIVAALIGTKGRVPGKKVFQKLVYFLQECEGLPLGLTFRMKHYGPFSEDLEDLADDLAEQGRIAIVDKGDSGFEILSRRPGPNLDAGTQDKIDSLLAKVGDEGGLTLELLATIHFLARGRAFSDHIDESELIKRVRVWKGSKYQPQFIRDNLKKLVSLGYLSSY